LRRDVAGQGQARAPVLRGGGDKARAERGEAIGGSAGGIRPLEARKREAGALRGRFDQALPCGDCLRDLSLLVAHVAEAEVRGYVARIALDRRLEPPRRLLQVAALQRGLAELVLEERQDLVVPRRVGAALLRRRQRGEALPHGIGLVPLVLILV